MNSILFIHSAGPQEGREGSQLLAHYLKKECVNTHNIIHPAMPSPLDPYYAEWRKVIRRTLDLVEGEVTLIGHSLGGSVLLKFLAEEEVNIPINKLISIAAPFWGINKEWQRKDFILHSNISEKNPDVPNIFFLHSKLDAIVPIEHMQRYSKHFPQAKFIELEGDAHLFTDGLPMLVELLKEV
ncbi:putative esterase of the alpha/beta hydrolase fold protein [Oceanobacillus picturae]|uniref:Esterase of the alpha/beta hydrolase fold protein n=1 Tax=Oceanobacillus picturae TaxID=171693 RepID=W9APS1_9BACI|nr:alpha/beta hydrolase [Oceanobacillus picturae]RIU92678.1 alpha/beta hydrolase [Oceanobacillus picturae]CDO04601.1 putative esterase of the alpha/beta hydrolase fold protein [Oceanobacillus picturae]